MCTIVTRSTALSVIRTASRTRPVVERPAIHASREGNGCPSSSLVWNAWRSTGRKGAYCGASSGSFRGHMERPAFQASHLVDPRRARSWD
jgi:hypothetical protein